LAILFLCAACNQRNDGGSFNYDGFEHDIRANLPIGSSYTSIEAYLSERKIGHSYDAASNTFYDLIPDVDTTHVLVTASVQITITLDNQRRLERLDVKRVYTGP